MASPVCVRSSYLHSVFTSLEDRTQGLIRMALSFVGTPSRLQNRRPCIFAHVSPGPRRRRLTVPKSPM